MIEKKRASNIHEMNTNNETEYVRSLISVYLEDECEELQEGDLGWKLPYVVGIDDFVASFGEFINRV